MSVNSDSLDDLVKLLKSTDTNQIKFLMGEASKTMKARTLADWDNVLGRVWKAKQERALHGDPMDRSYDVAMEADYNIKSEDCWIASEKSGLRTPDRRC